MFEQILEKFRECLLKCHQRMRGVKKKKLRSAYLVKLKYLMRTIRLISNNILYKFILYA